MSKEYLKNHRLGEVIALIQVLAFHRNTSRSESGLKTELKASPQSASSWIQLAKSHPEIFRVRDDNPDEEKIDRVSLVSRYVAPYSVENGKRIREPLSSDIVQKLIEVAIELHDRQLEKAQLWKTYVPIVVAVTAGLFTIFGIFIKSWLSNGGA